MEGLYPIVRRQRRPLLPPADPTPVVAPAEAVLPPTQQKEETPTANANAQPADNDSESYY